MTGPNVYTGSKWAALDVGLPNAEVLYNFEDGTKQNWNYNTTFSSSSSWGLKSVSAPDGGSNSIYCTQSSGGGNDAEIYSQPVDYDWAQSYNFEFLFKSDSFNDTGSYLSASLGWRGLFAGNDAISMGIFNDDDTNSFVFQSGGQSNSTSHTVDWKENTWYWIRGEADEQNGTVKAKIWEDANSEPSSYQISADITTGVSNGEVHLRVNGYSKLDITLCHAKFDY